MTITARRLTPPGYSGARRDPERVKHDGWHDLGVLVVAEHDNRLTWPERELVRQLGAKLYGTRLVRKQKIGPVRHDMA